MVRFFPTIVRTIYKSKHHLANNFEHHFPYQGKRKHFQDWMYHTNPRGSAVDSNLYQQA
jgi:hypothetical protein